MPDSQSPSIALSHSPRRFAKGRFCGSSFFSWSPECDFAPGNRESPRTYTHLCPLSGQTHETVASVEEKRQGETLVLLEHFHLPYTRPL